MSFNFYILILNFLDLLINLHPFPSPTFAMRALDSCCMQETILFPPHTSTFKPMTMFASQLWSSQKSLDDFEDTPLAAVFRRLCIFLLWRDMPRISTSDFYLTLWHSMQNHMLKFFGLCGWVGGGGLSGHGLVVHCALLGCPAHKYGCGLFLWVAPPFLLILFRGFLLSTPSDFSSVAWYRTGHCTSKTHVFVDFLLSFLPYILC